MERYKWFEIGTGQTYEATVSALRACYFDADNGYGFRLEEPGSHLSEFSFIQESAEVEEYTDPFGEPVVYEIKRYIEISFAVILDAENTLYLRVLNPPRSVKSVKDAFASVFGYRFYIAQVNLDIVYFMESVARLNGRVGFQVTRLKVTGLSIGEKSLGSLVVASTTNAIEDFKKSFPNSNHTIERLKFSLIMEGTRQEFEISSSGLLVVSHELSELVASAVHSSFSQASKMMLC